METRNSTFVQCWSSSHVHSLASLLLLVSTDKAQYAACSMTRPHVDQPLYSLIIATTAGEVTDTPSSEDGSATPSRLGQIEVDWVDFVRDKDAQANLDRPDIDSGMSQGEAGSSVGTSGATERRVPGSASRQVSRSARPSTKRRTPSSPSDLSLQPLLAHLPGHGGPSGDSHPHPLDASVASGVTQVGRGVVHLFRHAPPASLIASLDAHPIGEGSQSATSRAAKTVSPAQLDYAGQQAEGEDGSLVAILAVPAWMRPADFLEFIGGWGTCLEGVRMIR